MHFGDIDKIYAGTDSVSKVFLGTDLIWPYTPPTPVSGDYLTMQIVSGGTINWYASDSAHTKTISYSINGGPWTYITSSTGGTSFNVNSGDTVLFKGINNSYSYYASHNPRWLNAFYQSTASFNLSGNILSLIYGDNFVGRTTVPNDYALERLFAETKVLDAVGLKLPPVTTQDCYFEMFDYCTALRTAPELPATTLVDRCYARMFHNCVSLETAPALPATTLAYSCYYDMFNYCTALRTAPALPATTLAYSCYEGMFNYCTALRTAPALPATTLVNRCYMHLFYNCGRLNRITCLATNIQDSDATSYWVTGVASSGTFVKDANMTGWTTGDNGIPEGWTVQDA